MIEIKLTGKRAAENLELQYRKEYTLRPAATLVTVRLKPDPASHNPDP